MVKKKFFFLNSHGEAHRKCTIYKEAMEKPVENVLFITKLVHNNVMYKGVTVREIQSSLSQRPGILTPQSCSTYLDLLWDLCILHTSSYHHQN